MATRKKKEPPPIQAPEYCGICKFYCQKKSVCRLDPGKVFVVDNDVVTIQPTKDHDDWCGQFFPKGPLQ